MKGRTIFLAALMVLLVIPAVASPRDKGFRGATSNVPRHEGRSSLDQGGENCLDAFDLTLAGYFPPFSISGSTDDHLGDFDVLLFGPLNPPCWTGYYDQFQSCSAADVTYRWTVPTTGSYRISLCGSYFDTGLLVYNYACPPNFPDYLCGNDDHCGLQSEVGIPLVAGQEILIVVDGWGGSTGVYTLTIEPMDPLPPPCPMDSFFDVFSEYPAEQIRGAELLNTTLTPSGHRHALGRSLLIGVQDIANQALMFHAITLEQYIPFPGVVPEHIFTFNQNVIPAIQPLSFCLSERSLGVQREDLPIPTMMLEAEGPMVLLAGELSGQIAAFDINGRLMAGPYTAADFGMTGLSPTKITYDDDHFRLYVLDQQRMLLHTIYMPFDSPPELLATAPVPWPDILGRPILDTWSVDPFFDVMYRIDFGTHTELRSLNMTNPAFPVPGPSCTVPIEIVALSLSSGYGPLGTGQMVGLRDFAGIRDVVIGDPLMPAPLPNYLQPIGTLELASENPYDIQGPINIYGSLLGPWWPTRVRFRYSYDGLIYTDFFVDNSGLDLIAETVMPSPFPIDGWRAQFEPINAEPESLFIQLCYEVEVNGALVYVQRKVRIQDLIKPEITEPGSDGEIKIPPLPPGGISHPSPARVDCTVVFRRIPAPSVADSVKPVKQRRDSLSSWDSGVAGGDHCGPAAAAANLLALASRNPDLCRLLEKLWGRAPGTGCANPTPAELTKLLKELGWCMKTNDGHCGTWTSDIVPGIECLIRKLRGMFPDSTRPDPSLRVHWIPSGSTYDSLKWADIVKEFDERHQNLEILATDTLGGYGHFLAIKSISAPDSQGCATVEIADSWNDTVYTVKVDTRAIPPRFKGALPAGDFWGQIYQCIAISNPDSLTADSLRNRDGWHSHELDEDRYPWEIVQIENGPSTTFPLDDVTPGWWTYGVRVWTAEGDSATTYRTFYVAEPPNLVIQSVPGGNVQLSWQTDPAAVGYIIWQADVPGGPYSILDTVVGSSYTVSVAGADKKFYAVQPKWLP